MNSEQSTREYRALPMAGEDVVTQRPRVQRATVLAVEADSAAGDAGILAGDVLTHINDVPTLDIVDYQYNTAGESVTLRVERTGVPMSFSFSKGYDEDLGLEFADDLFDKVHICKNKCVFCFLYQQPKGLRSSLYIKDDDYRLSFLHGNYLTLTNMGEDEFARVIAQKLSPLFVSVHATDPVIRGNMLGRKEPSPILPRLNMLADARIQVHAQVVLCPGYNDGEILQETVHSLASLHPGKRGTYGGVLTVAIVPVGLTQFRDRLAALEICSPPFCSALVAEVDGWRAKFREELGTNFAFLSDEIYLSAGSPLPPTKQYEGFPQLEDGIGLVRQFVDDHARLARRLPPAVGSARSATLVTGELAAPLLNSLAETMNKIAGVQVNVAAIHNTFFEGNISVAGLLTGKDVVDHLRSMGDALGDRVIVPQVMLRDPDRDIFLDDMSLADFTAQVAREVCVVDRTPSAAAQAVLG